MNWRCFGCVFFALTLSSCTTAPAKLTLATRDVTVSNTRTNARVRQVCLLPIEDQRANSESLGQVAGRPFSADDLTDWIAQSLNSLAPDKYLISEKVQKEEAPLVIKVSVLKAYVHSIIASKTAVIVLKVECNPIGKEGSDSIIVRGQYTGPNWASTTGEIQAALQTALKQCTHQILSRIDATYPNGVGEVRL